MYKWDNGVIHYFAEAETTAEAKVVKTPKSKRKVAKK